MKGIFKTNFQGRNAFITNDLFESLQKVECGQEMLRSMEGGLGPLSAL